MLRFPAQLTAGLSASGLPHASGPGSDAEPSSRLRKGLSILIVEDEIFVALDAEAILTDSGHKVVGFAASAAEAIEKTAQLRPDLILMDVRLNGPRDGIDAADEIKRRCGIPIIIVTAHEDATTKARAARVGAAAIVSKPFTRESLLGAVDPFARP